jgi:hypothetical protein
MGGRDLRAERLFWTTDLIDWDRVVDVGDWCRFRTYWTRRVNYQPNRYGDTPYVVINFDLCGDTVSGPYVNH